MVPLDPRQQRVHRGHAEGIPAEAGWRQGFKRESGEGALRAHSGAAPQR